MNWENRGWVREGYKADLVVFDLKNIQTPTSISNPHQRCEGVAYVLINGKFVVDNGKLTKKLPGRVLMLDEK
jgi:N-acyl-D-amino-acid deacylase